MSPLTLIKTEKQHESIRKETYVAVRTLLQGRRRTLLEMVESKRKR